jgi:uncharacterized membrane protein YeaQ/YmgE (transglycosylase-associated protein family)
MLIFPARVAARTSLTGAGSFAGESPSFFRHDMEIPLCNILKELSDRPTDWLIDWVADWLTGWLCGWVADWLTDGVADWLTGWVAVWLTDGVADLLIGWVADLLTGWFTDWLSGWLTDWLTDWMIDWVHSTQCSLINWYTYSRPKVHHLVHKFPPSDSLLSQFNSRLHIFLWNAKSVAQSV